jgi:aspartyl-tRNA(Asn)/glutamyl-tRNA(Gln) amidotransferase subunit A
MDFESQNERLNVFITLRELQTRKTGALSDLTFGIKDIIHIKGIPTTAGSKILNGFVPEETAPVVNRILQGGGRILGKTNTHEFAAGATNTSSIAGPARNPVDPERISGGSSGGSAAAVAAGMVDVGIGSDTGGSIRIPASLCGVIGFKPTAGLIETEGLIPFSWTLDTVGILARDLGLVKRVLRSLVPPKHSEALVSKPKRKLKLGSLLFANDAASKALQEAIRRLKEEFEVVEVEFPQLTEKGSRVRGVITLAEAAVYHADWMRTRAKDYFPDVRSLLERGASIRATEYISSLQMRDQIKHEYAKGLKGVDAVISPTTRIPAPRIDDVTGKEIEYRMDLLSNTELFNVVGAPSISLPAAGIDGLPIGLMLSGMSGEDGALLQIAEKILPVLDAGSAKKGKPQSLRSSRLSSAK